MPDRISWFIDGRPVQFSDWSADCVAYGGFRDFAGTARGDCSFAEQEAPLAGFRRDGSPFWYGTIVVDPEVTEGGAAITAQGLYKGTFSTTVGRRLFMVRVEAGWKNQEVKPYGYNNVGRAYDSKIEEGQLVWWAAKGQDVSIGDTTGWVYWAEGCVLTNVSAITNINNGANPGRNEYQISTGFGPNGAVTVEQNGISVSAGTFDVPLNKTTGDLITIEVRRNNNASPGDKILGRVGTIILRGLAPSDVFTLDQVFSVILQIDARPPIVQASGLDMMPLDWNGTDFDLCVYLSQVGDWWFMLLDRDDLGTKSVAGPWDTAIQVARRRNARTQLTPLQRYNRVRVPWTTTDDAERFAVADAVPNPFPDRVVEYMADGLEDKFPGDSDTPQTIADTLIKRFSTIRRSGSIEVASAVLEGKTLSPYEIRPGLLAEIIDHDPVIPPQRIQAVSWNAAGRASLSIEREEGAVKTLRDSSDSQGTGKKPSGGSRNQAKKANH